MFGCCEGGLPLHSGYRGPGDHRPSMKCDLRGPSDLNWAKDQAQGTASVSAEQGHGDGAPVDWFLSGSSVLSCLWTRLRGLGDDLAALDLTFFLLYILLT